MLTPEVAAQVTPAVFRAILFAIAAERPDFRYSPPNCTTWGQAVEQWDKE